MSKVNLKKNMYLDTVKQLLTIESNLSETTVVITVEELDEFDQPKTEIYLTYDEVLTLSNQLKEFINNQNLKR